MIIGFMRNNKNPGYLAKLTAIMCKGKGMDLLFLTPNDINIKTNTVKGKMFVSNKWIEVTTEIPKIIDVNAYSFTRNNREVMQYLSDNVFLTDDRTNLADLSDNRRPHIISKVKLQNLLEKDGVFKDILIPTTKINDFADIINFIDTYSTIVLKPISGERGRGVYILSKKNNEFLLGFKTKNKILNYTELKKFYQQSIQEQEYILQKHINSRTLQGDPFDCRVHVEKNGKGKWTTARNFIRIGIGQKVISNVNQGGIADPLPFLKANFSEQWETIFGEIKK